MVSSLIYNLIKKTLCMKVKRRFFSPSSLGRGSDSETDLPHRKMPDVKKDDMLARRTSHGEPKSAVPFNQYLPNKSNQTFYVPAPLRKKKAEREEYRKSWSTATSPLGDRPFR